MAIEENNAEPDTTRRRTRSATGKIIGGLAIIVLGSLLGVYIIFYGIFDKAWDWEGYKNHDFPYTPVGVLVILVALIVGFILIISAFWHRKPKKVLSKPD